MLKAIIFDMDGVIIDSFDAWFDIFNRALMEFENRKISKEEFGKNIWAHDFKETKKEYFSNPGFKLSEYFKKYHQEVVDRITLFSDVHSTLKKLKDKNLLLTVATNTTSSIAKMILEKENIHNLFAYLVGGDQVDNGKPNPAMLIKTLKDMKLNKEEVVFIGDTRWDKEAAEGAGIKFIGLKTEGDERVEQISELLNIVK